MSVAGVEPEGDAAASLVKNDVLAPDRPVAGKRPVVDLGRLGSSNAWALAVAASADAKRSLRP
jgi:hypothetical protein